MTHAYRCYESAREILTRSKFSSRCIRCDDACIAIDAIASHDKEFLEAMCAI
jgi:hypothetical protein